MRDETFVMIGKNKVVVNDPTPGSVSLGWDVSYLGQSRIVLTSQVSRDKSLEDVNLRDETHVRPVGERD